MKSIYRQHKFLVLIAIFSFSATIQAQVRTSYFMKTSSARTSINPALRPDQGYFGFPFLNNVYMSGMTNTFMMENFLFPNQETPDGIPTFMHKDVSYDQFIKNISDNNYVSTDLAYDLFSAGWYRGDGFWTLNLGVKMHSDVNMPKSFFDFMKKGFSNQEARTYNMKDTRFIGNAYGEIGLGYSRSFMDDNLLLGVKGKVLLGLADIDANITDLSILGSASRWEASSRATLSASAPGIYATYKDDGTFDSLEFDEDEIAIPGYGLGFDLGGAYALKGIADLIPSDMVSGILRNMNISASFTDIGFITWSKKNSIVLESPATVVTLDQSNMNSQNMGNGYSLADQFEDAVDDLQTAMDFQPADGGDGNESRTTSLRMTMNWGLEYEITKMISVGLLSSTFFNHSHNQTELTLSGNYAPLKWLATSVSYSFIHSQFDTFGFALHLAPSKGVKFFIASDYVIPHVNSQFMPTTSKGVNAQFGLSIPLGARH